MFELKTPKKGCRARFFKKTISSTSLVPQNPKTVPSDYFDSVEFDGGIGFFQGAIERLPFCIDHTGKIFRVFCELCQSPNTTPGTFST
jgi:hypothetical protein